MISGEANIGIGPREVFLKGTVMQIEKALINVRLRVSKVSQKISHYNYL